ncbi:hypothetical protein [Haloferax sp. Atlit-6N]|uniref:hypothetical protein n=1 Tax=Haloferax sp. Atlit-6N TaxID=2077205 RepID=UPI0011C07689|nr:hypothetical protein [Haloferax sp. Atlit-6N]
MYTLPHMMRYANLRFHNYFYQSRFKNGKDILSSDWDNLLLLDACRYDMFDKHVDLPGELSKVQSKGSMTAQFLEENFESRDATDTVYVTGNPMLRRIQDSHNFNFHKIIDVWSEGWDSKFGTVLPETILKAAKSADQEYPNKRLIVHFMQPHFPFITNTEFDKQIPDPGETSETQFWIKLRKGDIELEPDEIWPPYVKNLEKVVPALRELLSILRGNTVVTSDHGNMVGEKSSPIPISDWGHPRGLYTPELVDVPWLFYQSDTQKNIISEEPEKKESFDQDVIGDRLKNLGYVE